MAHFLREMWLQGIMEAVFIVVALLDWTFVLMNATNMIPYKHISLGSFLDISDSLSLTLQPNENL